MKKWLYGFGVLLIALVMAILYYRFFNISYVLNEEGFSKEDILIEEEYLILPGKSGTLFLLADPDKIGLIFSRQNKHGMQYNRTSSVRETTSVNEWATIAFAQPTDILQIDSHILVAYYVDDQKSYDIIRPTDFELHVEFIPVYDRVLLFAHAVNTKLDRLGSDEVVAYLESHRK